MVQTYLEWDWEGGETAFRKAIEINPNDAGARLGYAGFLTQMKRLDEARVQVERGLELDPLNPLSRVMDGHLMLYEGRYAEAIEDGLIDGPVVFNDIAGVLEYD